MDVTECPLCFCAVLNLSKHRVWHDQQRRERERLEKVLNDFDSRLRRLGL